MREIKFFEIESEQYEKPSHEDTHTACGTPNPPWWCENSPKQVPVEMHLFVLVIIAFLFGIVVTLLRRVED